MAELAYVPSVVRQQFEALGPPRPIRRGSLSERYMTCSKPGCACAEDPDARHGPYFSLTRTVQGRTQSRLVGAKQADLVRQQVAAGQEFRAHIEAYWQVCEQWADDQLTTPEAASQEAAKKGASKRRSKRRSSTRLKRS
jgi:hypothetical protein